MSGDLNQFLAAFPVEPLFHLTAIGERGPFAGVTLCPKSDLAAKVGQRAERYNRDRGSNVYFSVNAPATDDPLDKKGKPAVKLNKDHIGTLRAIWADLDPIDAIEVLPSDDTDNPAMTGRAKEKTRLLGLAEAMAETDFAPSMAIDSGNGVQLLWIFEESIEATPENKATAEATGHRIEAVLGGTENTSNVDRVLRLPGTTNRPTAKKRKLGRVECPARLLYAGGPLYDFAILEEVANGIENDLAPELVKAGHIIYAMPEPEPDASPEPTGPEAEIDPSLPAALLALLANDDKLRRAWTKGVKLGKGKDKSASALDMSLTLYLCRKLNNSDLDLALRAYPFGQIGGGTLTGDAAERRLRRLIEIAEKARALVQFDDTQDGIAQAFAEMHRDKLRYDHTAGAWFRVEDGIWRKDTTKLAFSWTRHIGRTLGFDGKASTAGGAEKFAQCDEVFAVTHEVWDADPFLLGTPEGTLDLRTGRLLGNRPDDMITRSTAVAPKRGPHPVWSAFLDDATGGNKELQRFLQQIAGYSLTADTREHALFFIYGPGGNGKGVFLNTLTGILGDYATTAGMDTFTASHSDRHPTDLAMLNGARLVTASETEDGKPWAEARIKQLTGGDPITARFMRRDFFTYLPRFKLVIIGNHKPALRNVDDAARRRFNIIPFEHKPSRPDMQLGEQLKAEWPAILQWAIDGCLDWQRNGLARPEVVVEATAEYFEDQDLYSQWLGECCRVHPLVNDKSGTLYHSWRTFAEGRGVRPGDMKSFAEKLKRSGFKKERPRQGDGKRGSPVWSGVQLTAEARAEEQRYEYAV